MATLDEINEVVRRTILPGVVKEMEKESAFFQFLKGRNRFKKKCFDLFFLARHHGYVGGLYSTWSGAKDTWR